MERGADNYQQAAVSPLRYFFNPPAGGGDVGGNLGRHGMALRQFRGRYQAFNARGTQFVLFYSLGSQKSVSSAAKMPGSDAHHDKPIPAYCKSRA